MYIVSIRNVFNKSCIHKIITNTPIEERTQPLTLPNGLLLFRKQQKTTKEILFFRLHQGFIDEMPTNTAFIDIF